ncbi:hypothetical protein D9753_13160 [Streptomyces dangxiongensis]|uniref:Uncharacterized protein n=1 Tax=Streptomyces dangxiongensis TaxID=1442032 RepID=A0A3G2JEB8_9ACTN|nr:hypothetical protein D9753_13160 [Streptomyces dangxiongensis]
MSSLPRERQVTQATPLRTTAVPTTGGVRLLCVRPGILDAWTAGTSSRPQQPAPAGRWTGGRS